MAVTLKDIADSCGVDVSTVSRALRQDPRVKVGTRDRIREVAARLHYIPNVAARSLVGARTRTVWMLLAGMTNPLEQVLADEASRHLAAAGYDLSVTLYHGDRARYVHLLRRLTQRVADGAIVVPGPLGSGRDQLEILVQRGIPVVFADRHPDFARLPVVTTNNAAAAADLAAALRDHGADHFVVLIDPALNSVERSRYQGVVEFLGLNALPFTVAETLRPEFLKRASGLGIIHTYDRSVREFLQAPPVDFSGVDLHIGVFDRWHGGNPGAGSITVCEQDFPAIARCASELVLGQLKGAPAPPPLTLVEPLRLTTVVARAPVA